MTKYTVTWHATALAQLADLWNKHADLRDDISAASRLIDRHLQWDAHGKGEALPDGLKGEVVPPLVVVFTVSESDRLVDIGAIRLVRQS